MAVPRGYRNRVTAATERIAKAIASFEHREFTLKEVRAAVPGVSRYFVTMTVCVKTRAGWLERVGYGRYRIGGVKIRTNLPMAIVAEALWAALSTDPERKFRRAPELIGEAESYLGRPGVSLRSTVFSQISRWHRDGWLERTGPRGEYAYRLKEGVTERPVCRK